MRREFILIFAALVLMALSITLLKIGRREVTPLEEFVSAADEIRAEIKFGEELSEYLIIAEGSQYLLSPSQTLYYAADAIIALAEDGQFSIKQPISVAPPDSEDGDWATSWRKIPQADYIELAREVRDAINSAGKAPGTLETPIGRVRFRDILFTFVRILASYDSTGRLPDEILFAPTPTSSLTWDNLKVPSSYAYFLLPTDYVITGSAKVKGVLAEVSKPGYDNRKLAEELCRWVSTNILPELYVGMPRNSEEVLDMSRGKCTDFTNLYLALLRTAGIPAREVSGTVVLEEELPGFELIGRTPENKPVVGHAWAEVYMLGEGWVTADPTTGSFGEMTFELNTEPSAETWIDVLVAYEMAHERI
jgi:transglutaminase-like putative cysteine protease